MFRYKEALSPAKRFGIRSGIYLGLGGGVSWMLIFFAYSLAFWYGTPLIIADENKEDGTYTPGVLLIVSCLSYCMCILTSCDTKYGEAQKMVLFSE